jgi:predicted MFS family arabinose efflux permease
VTESQPTPDAAGAVEARGDDTAPGRWGSLAAATTAQVGISYLEQGVAALVPYIKAEFGLSAAVAGIFGTSMNIGRAISGTLAIRPVSRHGERRMILVGGAASGVLALIAAASPTSPLVLLLLIGSGILQAVAILAGIVAVAVWFRGGGRGIAMGIRQAAVPVGGMLAAATLPFLALSIGWRPALAIAGGVSILTSIGGAFAYRHHGAAEHRPAPRESIRKSLVTVLRDRRVSRAVFAGAMLAAGQFVTLTYIQLFLVEDLGTTLHFAAIVFLVTQVAGFIGRLVWGAVSDLAFGGRRREVLLVILLLAAGGALGMGLADENSALSVAVPMAILLGFTTVGSPGVYIALISDLSPARGGVATMGVGITVIQGSAIVVPPIFGGLADATDSYRIGWLVLAGLMLLTAPLLFSLRDA